MKKLLSLLMAFSLALVPMLSFADESSSATQNIYNMLLEELTAANLSMTPLRRYQPHLSGLYAGEERAGQRRRHL
ncbi:MAG: hypothetical protein ACLTXW_06925 [Christensenellales bacterium]